MTQQPLSRLGRPALPTVKQLTNPAFALLLTPLSYSLLGFSLGIKTSPIPFGSLIVTFIFLLLVNLQEMIFAKFYRVPMRAKSSMLVLTNFLLFLPVIYFAQTYSIRIAIIAVFIVFVNHSTIAHLPSSHAAYSYHIILNALVKYTLGNILTYYIITRQLSTTLFFLMLAFSLFGMSVLHYKQKAHECRYEEQLPHTTISRIISIIFNLLVLIAYLLLWLVSHQHYTLIGMVFIILTLGCWVAYQARFKQSLTPGRLNTYLSWTMVLIALILGIGYHL